MGAICGIINLENEIDKNKENRIINSFKNKFENTEFIKKEQILFGGYNAHISYQSEFEIVPLEDKESNLIITADAILDDRENTLKNIDIDPNKADITNDTYIILEMYKKYGEKCVDYLIGDFAFVIYDKSNNSLFCVRDHVGKRTFHYKHENNKFTFATLSSTIFDSMEKKCPLNDEWIANFLAFGGPMHDVDTTITVFKDIMQLKPGYLLKYKNNEIEIKKYWNVDVYKEIKRKDEKDYAKGLQEILKVAVEDRLKTNGNIAISLSGGLDSTSVAAFAAMKLNEENKKLKAFTFVPFSKYKNYLNKYAFADESEKVKKFSEMYINIENEFCPFEDKNSLTDIDEHLRLLEHPYKFVQNFYWTEGIINKASDLNCKIILKGSYGNATISFGIITYHLITLLEKRKYIKLIKEINSYAKNTDEKFMFVFKMFLKMILPNFILKILGKNIEYENSSVINEDFAIKLNVEKRLKKEKLAKYYESNESVYYYRKLFIDTRAFSQIGGVETQSSLKYGAQTRDPTMDKRVIEYCFSIPFDEYVKNGETRKIIRDAMKNLIPDEIRLDYITKGFQSADWIQRIERDIPQINKYIKDNLDDKLIKYYLNIEKINEIIKKESLFKEKEIWILVMTYVFIKFIKAYDINKKETFQEVIE